MTRDEAIRIGAPSSLARFKSDHPEDWHRLLDSGEGYEALDLFVCGSNPTHHLPVWVDSDPSADPPSRYDVAWELGERTVAGRAEYLYATRVYWHGVPTLEILFDYQPLDPILYSRGERPGSGPVIRAALALADKE